MRYIRLRRASVTSPSISIFSSFAFIFLRCVGEAAAAGAATASKSPLGDGDDVRRLGALLTLALFELDLRTLGQALEAVTGNARVVHEEILATALGGDETVALRVVETLHGSACHIKTPPITALT